MGDAKKGNLKDAKGITENTHAEHSSLLPVLIENVGRGL
jgi:hypothetical protein